MGAPEHFRHHVPLFLPAVFDRLGDLKAPVREAGRKLLVALMVGLHSLQGVSDWLHGPPYRLPSAVVFDRTPY
jgi:hypothetical protein